VNFGIAINDRSKPKEGARVELTTKIECAYWLNAKVGQSFLFTFIQIF